MNLLQVKLDNLDHIPTNTFIVPFLYPDYIEGCVESIWKFCDPRDHRLIVVDCGQNEKMFDRLRGSVHLYLDSYRNLGCAKAWNTGLRLVDTAYATIMGDDTRILHKNWWAEAYEHIKDDDTGIWFCHPCHLTQPSKVRGELEPPEFTDAMWEETKDKSGDMVGRFNALILGKPFVYSLLFSEALYPCEQVDGWLTFRLEEMGVPKKGIHFPVWHMRAMTYQRGGLPLHDKGKPNPDYKKVPLEIRHL